MLKLSSPCLIKPLSIIFQNCLKSSIFLDDWKKRNILPVHKKVHKNIKTKVHKNSKQIVNNCRAESRLPICSKSFEKLTFDSIFNSIIPNEDTKQSFE